MARSRAGRFQGFTGECNVKEYVRASSGIIDHWCIHHGEFILTCLTCGRAFHSKRPQTKHCSTACSQYAYRQRSKQVAS